VHLSKLFALANGAQLLVEPELAARRLRVLLESAGVVQ
jgi:hypothetical protein